MRVLFIAAVLALPASAASAPAIDAPARDMPALDPYPDAGSKCPPISRYHIARRNKERKPLGARKLTELPVADMYLAVDRRIDGCNIPIIVRYGIGGG